MPNDGLPIGDGPDDDPEEGADRFDCWPRPGQGQHDHPWRDCKRNAADFDAKQEAADEYLLPQYKLLGAERDDPGALFSYHVRRLIEHQIADKLYFEVAPIAAELGDAELSQELSDLAKRMYVCRTAGPYGMKPGSDIKVQVGWEEKCGQSKLCPDEARHEAKRLYDRYGQTIADYGKAGGRLYSAVLTLPNYPGGRLREGMRYIFKRFSATTWRAQKKGCNKFGIETALTVLEAPLGEYRDWNIHLNVVLLCKGRLDWEQLRKAWGYNLHIREIKRFDEKGMHALFNEVIKYATRSVPEKSLAKHHTDAPPFVEWTAEEIIEWYKANKGFRRTRAYGIERDENGVSTGRLLYGIPKPQPNNLLPTYWLGRIEWHSDGYKVAHRRHNLPDIAKGMLEWNPRGLDLIRGDKSTRKASYKEPTGPP